MKNKPLFNRIYRHHLDIIKELNNSYIFIQRTREALKQEINLLSSSAGTMDKLYSVPVRKGKVFTKEAYRTDKELIDLLNLISERDLFENFIVTNVSKFENYLFKTLAEVIIEYPKKLNVGINGVKPYKAVPFEFVVESLTIEDVIIKATADRVTSLSYATPQQYLQFFQEVTGCNTSGEEFADYIEIKATRDLLVHNEKKVNEVYLEKVGQLKRAELNQLIPINCSYFDFTIATMKRISGIIRRDLERKYSL